MDPITLTYQQAKNRLKDIAEDLERLDAKADKSETRTLDDEDKKYWRELVDESRALTAHVEKLQREEDKRSLKRDELLGRPRSEPGADPMDTGASPTGDSIPDRRFADPWDTSQIRMGLHPSERASELRARALTAIERMPAATDEVRKVSTALIERADAPDGRMAQLLLATSSEDYLRAFVKLVRNQGAPTTLEQREAGAYNRAMSLTSTAGGFLVPFQLDPTVILTAAGSRNQIRQIARVVTATGDVWRGVSSAGVTGSWDAEAAEVSDDAPIFAQPQIPVHKGSVFVPISIEAQQDAENVAQEIADMIAFEKDRMEAEAFVVGTGVGMPTGIVTALTGTTSVVPTATADTFAVGDVYALDNALPARYRAGASWLGHRAIYNLARRFDSAGGANLWTTLGNDVPQQLLGRPAYEAEAMDSTLTATAANPILVYGDFRNYVIADRVGTTVEFIPHLFGANRRPTGQRGWYAYFRVGATSVNNAAFRMLDA